MTERYQATLTKFEYQNPNPTITELPIIFSSHTEAENAMLHWVIDDLSELNGIMENGSFPERGKLTIR